MPRLNVVNETEFHVFEPVVPQKIVCVVFDGRFFEAYIDAVLQMHKVGVGNALP